MSARYPVDVLTSEALAGWGMGGELVNTVFAAFMPR